MFPFSILIFEANPYASPNKESLESAFFIFSSAPVKSAFPETWSIVLKQVNAL